MEPTCIKADGMDADNYTIVVAGDNLINGKILFNENYSLFKTVHGDPVYITMIVITCLLLLK